MLEALQIQKGRAYSSGFKGVYLAHCFWDEQHSVQKSPMLMQNLMRDHMTVT